jgi:predicted nucleic acid-binding protein
MILPDVDVLIYAFRKDVPQHPESRHLASIERMTRRLQRRVTVR